MAQDSEVCFENSGIICLQMPLGLIYCCRSQS